MKMRPPQTIGEDQPRPGTGVFHATWSVVLQVSGNPDFVLTPEAVGPRNCGQLSWPGTADDRSNTDHAQKISLRIGIKPPPHSFASPIHTPAIDCLCRPPCRSIGSAANRGLVTFPGSLLRRLLTAREHAVGVGVRRDAGFHPSLAEVRQSRVWPSCWTPDHSGSRLGA